MLNRRQALHIGLAAASFRATLAGAQAEPGPHTKVRYSEVIRSILYAPAYVAITKGFFTDAGLDVELSTANGGDKAIAALLSDSVDIALMGPESAIYVLASESPTKVRIFCGLTATDGFLLVGRRQVDAFDWRMLKGQDVLGMRAGSTPQMFLEAAIRQNGLDPDRDVKLNKNVGIPARVGSWLAGQNEYAIFVEPDASRLEQDGKAYVLASIGKTVGFADYTVFMATDQYIHDRPAVVQAWTDAIYRAQQWTAAAPPEELAKVLQPWFPGISPTVLAAAAARYGRLKVWKTSPVISPQAIDKFQDILVQGNVMKPSQRVGFNDLVRAEFAKSAK